MMLRILSPIAIGLTVLLLGTQSDLARAAELNPAEPFAFFSPKPALDPVGSPSEDDKLVSITLRPNVEQQAYVFAYNPKASPVSVRVTLATAALDKNRNITVQAGGELARTAQPIIIPGKSVVRVPLAGKELAAAAPAPAAGQTPAVVKPKGSLLPALASVVLRVEEAAAGEDPLAPKAKPSVPNDNTYTVDVFPPSSPSVGLKIGQKAEGRNALSVPVSFPINRGMLSDKPAKVSLDLRPDLNPGLDISGIKGTFEAEVAPGQTATLFVEGVSFDPIKNGRRNALIAVNVDGYDRAAVIETGFEQAADPARRQPNVRLAFTKGTPGKPCKVTVEADGVTVDDRNPLKLLIDRTGRGNPEEVLRQYTSDRRKEIYAGVSDEAVVFNPILVDWSIDFATERVIGRRTFQLATNNIRSPYADLLLDDTAPIAVSLGTIDEKNLITDKVVTLTAVGRDPESDIESAIFFTGEAPGADGKPAAGGKVIPGNPANSISNDRAYEATLRLPDLKGELKVGVVYTNKVGLRTVRDMIVYVRESETKEKKTTGSIEGVVMQGYRFQPGLPVELRDDSGKILKSATTDFAGKFQFTDLQPGAYVVRSVKRADANASGQKSVDVVAGDKPAKVEIQVLR